MNAKLIGEIIGSSIAAIIGGVLVAAATLFAAAVAPLFAILIGYWTGFIVDWITGDILTNGLNDLFNTAYFDGVHYPSMFAAAYLIISLAAVVLRRSAAEKQ